MSQREKIHTTDRRRLGVGSWFAYEAMWPAWGERAFPPVEEQAKTWCHYNGGWILR